MIELIIGISTVLILGQAFIVRNLNRQVNSYEKITTSQVEYLQKISKVLQVSYLKLKEVDQKGAFESDDEVGQFFKELKDTYEYINSVTLDENYGKAGK